MTQISLILFQFWFDFPISNLTSNPAPENCNQVQGGPQFHVSWSWETQWNAWIQKHFRHIGLLSDRLIYPSWQACEKKVFVQIVYSYGHLSVITGYKWDYTFYKWGYKYLQLVKGHNCSLFPASLAIFCLSHLVSISGRSWWPRWSRGPHPHGYSDHDHDDHCGSVSGAERRANKNWHDQLNCGGLTVPSGKLT